MSAITREKKELAEKIARKHGLKAGSQAFKAQVKSLAGLSLKALQNLK